MKKSRKLFTLLVIVAIVVTAIGYIHKVNAATTGVINEITVNVRKKASIDSDIIMTVTEDDTVEILEKTGDWYKINYKGTKGYIYADFITLDEKAVSKLESDNKVEAADDEVTENVQTKLQLGKNIGVKIAPTINSNIVYTTTQTEEVIILEQIADWSYIEISSITIRGWVRNSQTQESGQEESKTSEAKEEKTTTSKQIAYVKYDNVNMRKEPSADSTILEKLKQNTEVTIIEEVDSVWNKVKVDEKTGYISKDLLSDKKVEKEEKKEEATTTSRDGQSTAREEMNTKKEDSSKEEKTNKQTNVKDEKSTKTSQKDTKSSTETKTTNTTDTKGEEIVAYAKKYLNYDYVYGGTSPKTGFDCSGFTYYVYQHFGYTLPRSSVAQAGAGTKVEKKDLQPGDILIFKNRSLSKIGHVGIYIGNNKMIHASEPGVGVTITDIDSKAYNYPKRFVMGRRIIK